MRKILLFLSVFFFLQTLQAQEIRAVLEDAVFEIKDIDVTPDFPGGLDVFYTFFDKTFKKPDVPQLIGKLFISFIVEKDGSLTDVATVKDIGFGTGAEATRVLQLSPKWIPGKKAGKVVRVKYILPIGIHTD